MLVSCCAVLMSLPGSKTTLSEQAPLLEEVELCKSSPSMPLSCSSMGVATDSATSVALAPG